MKYISSDRVQSLCRLLLNDPPGSTGFLTNPPTIASGIVLFCKLARTFHNSVYRYWSTLVEFTLLYVIGFLLNTKINICKIFYKSHQHQDNDQLKLINNLD